MSEPTVKVLHPCLRGWSWEREALDGERPGISCSCAHTRSLISGRLGVEAVICSALPNCAPAQHLRATTMGSHSMERWGWQEQTPRQWRLRLEARDQVS